MTHSFPTRLSSDLLIGDDSSVHIRLKTDPAARTLVVSDNGIGMNRQELIDNLGTIARSGTAAFVQQLENKQDGANLIGQFGVGFYSAFMVAERVEVSTRSEEHTSELQSLMRTSYAVFCLKKKKITTQQKQ